MVKLAVRKPHFSGTSKYDHIIKVERIKGERSLGDTIFVYCRIRGRILIVRDFHLRKKGLCINIDRQDYGYRLRFGECADVATTCDRELTGWLKISVSKDDLSGQSASEYINYILSDIDNSYFVTKMSSRSATPENR